MKDYSDAACPFSARKVRKVVSKNYLNMTQKLIKSCSNTLLFLLSNQEIALSWNEPKACSRCICFCMQKSHLLSRHFWGLSSSSVFVHVENVAIFTLLFTLLSNGEMDVLKNTLNSLPWSDTVVRLNIFIPLPLLKWHYVSIHMVLLITPCFHDHSRHNKDKIILQLEDDSLCFLPTCAKLPLKSESQ